jgi:hypothetical protein
VEKSPVRDFHGPLAGADSPVQRQGVPVTLEELIPLISKTFASLNLPYFVFGGVAVSVWGEPRTTRDLDIVAKLDPAALRNLLQHLRQIGFKFTSLEERKIREGRLVQLRIGSTRLDVRRISSRHDEEALRRIESVAYPTFTLWVASPEDLILYKLQSWRTLDQADIENLATHAKSLDRQYLARQLPVVEEESGQPLGERWKEILTRLR